MPYIPLARQSKPAPYNGERLLNYIAQPADVLSQVSLLGRSGLVEAFNLGGPVRASVATERGIFAVAGGKLWQITATAVERATVPDAPDTYIAASTTYVALTVGGKYYVWNGVTLAEKATGAIDTPRGVIYRDGYFVVWGDALGRADGFQVSALDDATSFDALDILFAESVGDRIIRIMSLVDTLWVFGSDTIETYYNAGESVGVFRRNLAGALERGCLNGRTVAKDETGAYWLGNDGKVYRTAGVQPMVISTPEIEANLGRVSSGFIFNDRGHRFYALSRYGNTTLAFDLTAGVWCEFSTGIGDAPWMANGAVTYEGVQYLGTATGLATAHEDVFTDLGEVIRAEAITPPLERGGERFVLNLLDARFRTGALSIGRDPQVMLQASKDGQTWGGEKWRSLGVQGKYAQQVRWRALGQSRWFQFRFRVTDPVWRDIYGVQYA